jgi:hypothetical protein
METKEKPPGLTEKVEAWTPEKWKQRLEKGRVQSRIRWKKFGTPNSFCPLGPSLAVDGAQDSAKKKKKFPQNVSKSGMSQLVGKKNVHPAT